MVKSEAEHDVQNCTGKYIDSSMYCTGTCQ